MTRVLAALALVAASVGSVDAYPGYVSCGLTCKQGSCAGNYLPTSVIAAMGNQVPKYESLLSDVKFENGKMTVTVQHAGQAIAHATTPGEIESAQGVLSKQLCDNTSLVTYSTSAGAKTFTFTPDSASGTTVFTFCTAGGKARISCSQATLVDGSVSVSDKALLSDGTPAPAGGDNGASGSHASVLAGVLGVFATMLF